MGRYCSTYIGNSKEVIKRKNEQRACQSHHHKLYIVVVVEQINTNDVYCEDTKTKRFKIHTRNLTLLTPSNFSRRKLIQSSDYRYQSVVKVTAFTS